VVREHGGSWGTVVASRAVVALLAALVFLAPAGAGAQGEGPAVGYVDLQVIQAQYLLPNLQPSLAALEQRLIELQAKFDEESVGLDDEAKQALFNVYQAELNAQSAGVERFEEELKANIAAAIASVAAEHGVSTVLAKDVVLTVTGDHGLPRVMTQPLVLHGGIDLTGPVLRRLGVQLASPENGEEG